MGEFFKNLPSGDLPAPDKLFTVFNVEKYHFHDFQIGCELFDFHSMKDRNIRKRVLLHEDAHFISHGGSYMTAGGEYDSEFEAHIGVSGPYQKCLRLKFCPYIPSMSLYLHDLHTWRYISTWKQVSEILNNSRTSTLYPIALPPIHDLENWVAYGGPKPAC